MQSRSGCYPDARRHVIWHIQYLKSRGYSSAGHELNSCDLRRACGKGRSGPLLARLRGAFRRNPRMIPQSPWDRPSWLSPVTQKLIEVETSHLANQALQIFAPLLHQLVSGGGVAGRSVAQPGRAARPAKDLISEPSATISDVHRSSLTSISAGSTVCCFVKFAWSVQFNDRIGPSVFR